ncbi:threonine synthase [Spirochaeta thermophila DSM 6578]|uniref:Threonine synthase n=1 Tax=Winmispira thermophila (strain ATCC 700085 / DSM 6578 / Z-1203) TaxID=869211 RepID=G0GBI2_WINT7|nr:threonine synthase [Spirochaeta thermophila]AEJ60341.1 threonine synthase [Spirochaeta thermophila DSM 6578]
MRFVSTRNPKDVVSFEEAVFRGLAPDGGLYHPVERLDLASLYERLGPEKGFVDVSYEMVRLLFGDEFSEEEAGRLVERAFPFSPVLRELTGSILLLELFHGPSCAFKDFGASFLASCMEVFLSRREGRAVILTATSGDTGSAVAQAFHGRRHIDVVILYPSGRVSPLQEKQLTTLGGNVHALEVAGSFDDCQRMVKEAFLDRELRERCPLTSANSINLGRLVPQSFYYVWAYAQLKARGDRPFFCVPSGNFGNLTAGVYAWWWGMPVRGFLAATNVNDVVPEYLSTGVFTPRSSVRTLSNAMDVGNPSNFERLLALFEGDHRRMAAVIRGERVTDEETLDTIARYWREREVFLDPHTAVGVKASERLLERERGVAPVVTLATAHPGKFLEVVEDALGIRPPLPPQLEEVLAKEKRAVKIPNTLEALKAFLLDLWG